MLHLMDIVIRDESNEYRREERKNENTGIMVRSAMGTTDSVEVPVQCGQTDSIARLSHRGTGPPFDAKDIKHVHFCGILRVEQ